MPSLVPLIVVVLKISVFLNVLALGMAARASDATFVLGRPWLLLRSVFAMNVIMPLMAAAVVQAFSLRPALKVALLAVSLSPIPPMLPRREFKAGGKAPYTIGLLVSAAVLSVVLVPAGLSLFGWAFDKDAHVPEAAVARIVMTSVLSPLLIGMAIRYFAPTVAQRLIKPVLIAAFVLLVVGVLPVPLAWRSIVALLGDGTLLALIAFSIAGVAVGHWLGGPDPARRAVLALSTACRHPAIALTIASANVAEPKPVMAAIMLYLIVSILVSTAYLKLRPGRDVGTGDGGGVQDMLPTTAQARTMKRAWG
jgi:bile acid:Na+ symporter, BASS family